VESRNGLLTLAVYLTATALIVLAALLAIVRYGTAQRMAALPLATPDPLPELAVTQRNMSADRAAPTRPAGNRGMDQQRQHLLETMLDERTRRLQSQAQQLEQRTAELAELRARYDEVAALVLDALSHSAGERSEEAGKAGAAGGSDVPPGPETLAAELSRAREAHLSLAGDLALVQEDLATTQRELLDLRALRDRERTDHARELQMLEAAATSVLTRVGPESVPALRDLLNHPLPAVRRWAATMLGGLGPDAYEAVAALSEALSDNDASVRSAAQAALAAIER
jgi:DNA repair exonuclease SbcCD ATPase subunit